MTRGRMYVILLVSLIAVVAIQGALRSSRPVIKTGPVGQRQIAPSLSIPLEPGKPPVALSSLKGKVVLLDFWATWCGPCRETIPELEKLYEKYHSKGLEVIGISVDNKRAPVPGAVKELGMTYPVVMADDIPDIRSKFEFHSIPQLYVIDRQGRVAAAISGAGPEIEPQITPYLQESPAGPE